MSNPPNAMSYVLAAVILGMGVFGALLTLSIPAHFSTEGGDPAMTAGFAVGLCVLTVSMFVVKRQAGPFNGKPDTDEA
jgi:hypothetical protein